MKTEYMHIFSIQEAGVWAIGRCTLHPSPPPPSSPHGHASSYEDWIYAYIQYSGAWGLGPEKLQSPSQTLLPPLPLNICESWIFDMLCHIGILFTAFFLPTPLDMNIFEYMHIFIYAKSWFRPCRAIFAGQPPYLVSGRHLWQHWCLLFLVKHQCWSKGGIIVDIMHFNNDALATATTMMPLKDQHWCIVSPNCDASTFTRSQKAAQNVFHFMAQQILWGLSKLFDRRYMFMTFSMRTVFWYTFLAMLRKPFAKQIISQQNSGRFYLVQGVMQPGP